MQSKLIQALKELPGSCKDLLASKFSGKFEDVIALAGNTGFISTTSEMFRTAGPNGTADTYQKIWDDNVRSVGGPIAAAVMPFISYVQPPGGGPPVQKLDFRRENTVVYNPAYFGKDSPTQATSLAHEFFHIAYNIGDDVDLAKELGLDPSKFDGPTPQARASQAVTDFIDKKCQK